jgi:hypothetical protein
VWHMRTPLENLDDNCYLIIELKNAAATNQILFPPSLPVSTTTSTFSSFFGGGSTSTVETTYAVGTSIAWVMLPINLSTIDSGVNTLEMMQSPVVLPVGPKDPPPPPGSLRSDNSFLETSYLICKRGRDVDLADYRSQPEWVHHHRPLPTEDIPLPKDEGAADAYQEVKQPSIPRVSSVVDITKVVGLVGPEKDAFTDEQINAMNIRDLKTNLSVMGVDFSGFMEKSEFRGALRKATLGLKKSAPVVKSFKYPIF